MQERPHLSVHIEKTAGVSLREFYQRIYGSEMVFTYYPATDTLLRTSEESFPRTNKLINSLKLALAQTPFLPLLARFNVSRSHRALNHIPVTELSSVGSFRVIHGHFLANRFDNILPDSFMSIVLRDPMERMASQFLHWRRTEGHALFRTIVPYDPKVIFTEFAFFAPLQNYQTAALAGKNLTDFDLVGTTEKIDLFAQTLVRKLKINQFSLTSLLRLNTCPRDCDKNGLGITNEFTERFKVFHRVDYENYALAETLAQEAYQRAI
jgi:hypothetical protein